ncbi:UNVERIFIED_CONTAM: hypothetical protein Scaly_0972200 [Sesamum calycinum]|uniref:SWIM-type domain-containing protein n=1 Tax=Sesamum calycinum TaxID=2727403 RepID=A0AAW2QYM2_9LAMI
MSNQWGEYMNLLATPGLPPCSNTDYLAGTSNPDFGAGTSNLDFGAGTSHSEPEYYTPNLVTVTQGLENDVEDPTADSFVNESDEASKPNEAEYPIPPEDGPDRVDINVMAETFAQRGAETSSEPALPDMNTQPTFYRSIPFFQQTFPEIPADSVDVPNLRYAKFYNKSEGRLDKGMLFKTKEELMEAVQDHSIRHARREYYVTESSKTKWKVLCKHSTEGHVKCNPSYGIKHVIQNVKDQTGYDVPYQKAWYSLKWHVKLFMARGRALFKSYLPIWELSKNIIQELLLNGNTRASRRQLVLPLAFAVVDEETYPSWKWFLQQLSRHVIEGDEGCALFLTVMADSLKQFVKDLCWQAGSEYQSRKFNRIMDEIKKQDVKAFAYLDAINKEKWTASHDGGWRCGILTTNMSECINGVLKGARRLPLLSTRSRNTVTLKQSASVVTRRQGRHGMNTHVVKIANRECSCGKWNQFGIPCSHAQKVCGAYNISAASMVKDYYDVMAYNNTYSKHFEPVQSEDYWDDPNFQLVHDPTIRTVTRPGRNQTTRIHNEMDWRQTRARQEAQQQQGDSSVQENVP